MASPTTGPASQELYDTLLGCATDGRGRNARYRQNQLLFLHNFLRNHADAIRSAISHDVAATRSEVDTEFDMSLAAVHKLYDEIDFDKSLRDEFRIAAHKDNPEARIPYGIVLVRPTLHTRFFSITAAVATAFAAGNVVLLELEDSQLLVDGFFRKSFRTFDSEAFGIATSRVKDVAFVNKCLLVDQSTTPVAGVTALTQGPLKSVLAVLDRSANVPAAARAIIRSKCYFQGSSPNAVDTVLVNEWIKKEFIAQCQKAINAEAEIVKRTKRSRPSQEVKSVDENGEILLHTDGFTVSEVLPGARTVLQKSSALHFRLITVSGLVDITTVASDLGPLSAVFCFSGDHQAKYLGQHIDSQLFVVNQIPLCLLVGPSLPISAVVPDLSIRYSTTMMSKPAPQFINELDGYLKEAKEEETRPLKPFKQGSGFDIGFFDRGAILGGVRIILPTLGVLVYSACQAALYSYRWWIR